MLDGLLRRHARLFAPGHQRRAWNSWWGNLRAWGNVHAAAPAGLFLRVDSNAQTRARLADFIHRIALFGVFMGLTGLIHLAGLDFIFRFNEQKRGWAAQQEIPIFSPPICCLIFCSSVLIARGNKRQIYSFVAKTWLFLLIAMDVFLVIWDVASGGQILSAGLALVPIGVFAFLLHGATLFWFALRGKNLGWSRLPGRSNPLLSILDDPKPYARYCGRPGRILGIDGDSVSVEGTGQAIEMGVRPADSALYRHAGHPVRQPEVGMGAQ